MPFIRPRTQQQTLKFFERAL